MEPRSRLRPSTTANSDGRLTLAINTETATVSWFAWGSFLRPGLIISTTPGGAAVKHGRLATAKRRGACLRAPPPGVIVKSRANLAHLSGRPIDAKNQGRR
jgi:hypothetical protein